MNDQRITFTAADVAVAIASYGRDQVLVDTIEGCLIQEPPPGEIIVVDQTPVHDRPTEEALSLMHGRGQIRWERMSAPSIPIAMNRALDATERPIVLYLDDDVLPAAGLIGAHAAAHNEFAPWVVVGQIIQPWQEPEEILPEQPSSALTADFDFPFHSTHGCWLSNAMATNMSVRREQCRRIGGFDENFKGAAYRFETEFARRVIRQGGKIRFCPAASIRHLRVSRGGTRIHGNHLASASPNHGVGDYYFAMLEGIGIEPARYMSRRFVKEVATRFHLRHPWFIPVKMLGEFRAFCWACALKARGPALRFSDVLLPHGEVAPHRSEVAGQDFT